MKIYQGIAKTGAGLALKIAAATSATACLACFHQPKEPANLAMRLQAMKECDNVSRN